MSSSLPSEESLPLQPLPYQRQLLEYVQKTERELWEWFASHRVRNEHAENVRLDLLKSTYRLDRESHEPLFATARHVSGRLGLSVPITLYQGQGSSSPNVSIAYIPGEIHVVFHGNALELLTEPERRAVFGHELAHYVLLDRWDGQYMALGELLSAMSHDRNADVAHIESARLYALYTEIFCDRVALDITGELEPSVTSLVKLNTGLTSVSAASYLEQAAEILSARKIKTAELQHPETFIRVRALQLHHEHDPDLEQAIARLIESEPELVSLHLLAQQDIAERTRRLVDILLSEPWMQSDAALAHARLFFDGYRPPSERLEDESLSATFASDDKQLRDYYAYVLLDFVACDHERTEPALAWALEIAEGFGLDERLAEITAKELKTTKKVLQQVKQNRTNLIETARREFAEPTEGAS